MPVTDKDKDKDKNVTGRDADGSGDSRSDAPGSTQQDVKADNNKTDSGLRIERSQRKAPELDTEREVPLWERDDAPKGSTEGSLLTYENGVPVRVSGPTHYQHNADGSITGGYGIGTHVDNGDRIVPILAHYQG